MSTDANQQPISIPHKQCKTYGVIPHHNSNNSVRRGLVGWVIGKLGKPEFKHHTTIQIVKNPEGGPLPHIPFLTKRNKYTPHVGKKQLAKLALSV